MTLIPFRKKEEIIDFAVVLVNTLREVRTQIKQLKIEEKKLLTDMEKKISSDNYLYDENHKPIAYLSSISTQRFSSSLLKEAHPQIYGQFLKPSTYKKWSIL